MVGTLIFVTSAQDWKLEICSNIFEILYSAQIHVGMDDMVHSNWKLNKNGCFSVCSYYEQFGE